MLAFYLPVTIICVLYFQIWRVTKLRQVELRKLQCQKYSTRMKRPSDANDKKTGTEASASVSQNLVAKDELNFDDMSGKKLSFCSRYIKLSCIRHKSIDSSDEPGEDGFKYKVTSQYFQKCTHCNASLDSDIKKQEDSMSSSKNGRFKIEVKCSNCKKVVTLRFDQIRFSVDNVSSANSKLYYRIRNLFNSLLVLLFFKLWIFTRIRSRRKRKIMKRKPIRRQPKH